MLSFLKALARMLKAQKAEETEVSQEPSEKHKPASDTTIMRVDVLMAQEELEKAKKEFQKTVDDVQQKTETCMRKLGKKKVK